MLPSCGLSNNPAFPSLPPCCTIQGRTSRWAIAWSFSVDHNLASQPLPQTQFTPATGEAPDYTAPGQMPAGSEDEGDGEDVPEGTAGLADTSTPSAAAAAGVLGTLPSGVRLVRRMVWGVAAPVAEGQKLMSATAALLGSYGATCKVIGAAWMVEASLGFGAQGAGTGVPKPSAAAAAAGRGGGDGAAGAEGEEGGSGGPRPSKKARVDGSGVGAGDAGVMVRLKFVQEQSRNFTVAATIANTCGELEARLFMGTMIKLKEDLALMWDIN